MSLTSLLENNTELRAKLLAEFPKPEFRLKADIKAPPLTVHYGITGTAFDYLLRFYVKKLNPRREQGVGRRQQGFIFCVARIPFSLLRSAYLRRLANVIRNFSHPINNAQPETVGKPPSDYGNPFAGR